ncbi:glucokinase [Cohnella sp. OV330]|uniref:ROK family protein n=1 Tax=Cohnella sp. OV330 TaxID=1855288 RepID=UPI0008EE0440|nr:ROK family protein [Cohnella sp. OV330]SFB59514.1 glucokinase [Cohnella sp. OV330]
MQAALGIDIGGTHIKSGVVTAEGQVLAGRAVPTEADAGGEAVLAKLLPLVEEAAEICAQAGASLGGIGVGTAGQVNKRTGRIAGATGNLPGWAGIPLVERLGEASGGLPVAVDNDVNMIALGESWLGVGAKYGDFLCVALGTGIGGCRIKDGMADLGRDGYAGELGHMIVQMDGLPCTCGGRGCWEQYASVPALIRLARERGLPAEQTQPIALFEAAGRGDPAASAVLDAYAERLSVGLAGLIHIFNPPAIVIGGAVSAQGEALLNRIRARTEAKIMPVFRGPGGVDIVAAGLGDRAGFIGAARRMLTDSRG